MEAKPALERSPPSRKERTLEGSAYQNATDAGRTGTRSKLTGVAEPAAATALQVDR